MTMLEDAREVRWTASTAADTPFAETLLETPFAESTSAEPAAGPTRTGFTAWAENLSPFSETFGGERLASDSEVFLAEAFAELRDEAFDEAVAYLAEETEQAIADRFSDEAGFSSEDRERF